MIGKAYKLGTGFKGLAAYLETGKDGIDPERVDWIESRNLGTRDPETAARIMAATSRESVRTEKPVYHFSISFDHGDPVNRDAMRRVADRTLRDLGLEGHQVLIVAHRDRAHPHVHFVVNRVHPETGRAWDNAWDYPRIERSLRAQEVEMGLRVVPGKHAPVPEQARERAPGAPAPRVRGDAAFLERVREQAGPHLRAARSWDELERGLAAHGLALRAKGRGMVVTDGREEVKASDVDPQASRFRLEKKLGPLGEYRARQAVAARTLEGREAAPAPPAAPRAPERAPAPVPAREAAPVAPAKEGGGYREAGRRLDAGLREVYVHPGAARRAFVQEVDARGAREAVARLRDEPGRFGALRPGVPPERVAEAARGAEAYAALREARARPALREAAALLREAHAAQVRESQAAGHTQAAARAQMDAALMRETRASAAADFRRARELAGEVYEKPGRALRALDAYARVHGPEEAARAVREVPGHFGALRGVKRSRWLGVVREVDYRAAYERAGELAGVVRRLAPKLDERPRPGQVAQAEGRARAAVQAARALPGWAVDVRAHVQQAARRLASVEAQRLAGGALRAGATVARQLAPMLPPGAAELGKRTLSLARDLAVGRDPERDRGR